jgi:hypothetical protein
MDSAGDAAAAWINEDGSVEAAYRPAGSDWSAPQQLASRNGKAINLAMSSQGAVIVTWEDDVSNSVQVSERQPLGGAWSTAVAVSPSGPAEAHPAATFDPVGTGAVAWRDANDATHDTLDFCPILAGRCSGTPSKLKPTSADLSAAHEPGNTTDEGFDPTPPHLDSDQPGVFALGAKLNLEINNNPSTEWSQPWGTLRGADGIFTTDHRIFGAPQVDTGPFAFDVGPLGQVICIYAERPTAVAQSILADRKVAGNWQSTDTVTQAGQLIPDDFGQPGARRTGPPSTNLDGLGPIRLAFDANDNAIAVWYGLPGPSAHHLVVQTRSYSATSHTWGATTTFADPNANLGAPTLAANLVGDVVIGYSSFSLSDGNESHIAQTGQSLGSSWVQTTISGGQTFLAPAPPRVAMNDAGDAVAIWVEPNQTIGPDIVGPVETAGYDFGGPTLSGVSIPSGAQVGQVATFTASANDVWWGASGLTWSFGDGATAAGPTVTHSFSQPRTYTVVVTSTDGSGNSSSASGAFTATQIPTTTTAAPLFTTVAVSPLHFAVTYKESRAHGTVVYKASSTDPVTANVVIRREGARTGTLRFKYSASGVFTKKLTVPSTITPGHYVVAISASAPHQVVLQGNGAGSLPAPASGVVDQSTIAARKGFPIVTLPYLPKILYAHFHFAARPRHDLKPTVVWLLDGRQLSSLPKPNSASVDVGVLMPKLHGRHVVTCVLWVGKGKVQTRVAERSVRIG